MNKKFIWIIALVVLFIPTYLIIYNLSVLYSDVLMVENVQRVSLSAPGRISFDFDERDEIRRFIGMVDRAQRLSGSVNPDASDYRRLELVFFKGRREIKFDLYLSLDPRDCLLRDDSGAVFRIDAEDASRILGHSISDILYPHYNIPETIFINGQIGVIVHPAVYEWQLRKSDGRFHDSSIPTPIRETNDVTIFSGVDFDVEFALAPSTLSIVIYQDGSVVYDDLFENRGAFSLDFNTQLRIELIAVWLASDDHEYQGMAKFILDAHYDVPVSFDISSTQARPGEIIVVSAYNVNDSDTLHISVDDKIITRFYYMSGKWAAFVPICADSRGSRVITLSADSTIEDTVYTINITDPTFGRMERGASDENVEAHLSERAQGARTAGFNSIFATDTSDTPLWTASFRMPTDLDAPVFMNFGTLLIINRGRGRSNLGVDLEVPLGSSVLASNRGIVVYTGNLPETGNLVVIDHGLGIRSWYRHLDSIGVNVGDTIERGQEIGKAGRTGLWLGRIRLHFGISVGDVFVNPITVINDGIMPDNR